MRTSLRLLCAVALLGGVGYANADIVYDNTETVIGTIGFAAIGTDYANIVELDGTAREVSELTVYLDKQRDWNVGTIDFRVRLWSVDDLGTPDEMLYESNVINDFDLERVPIIFPVTFAIPNVLVEDTFAFSGAILERDSTLAVGYRKFGPPITGTWFDAQFLAAGGSSWTPDGAPISLGAQVTAVPEPAGLVGLLLGSLVALRRRG